MAIPIPLEFPPRDPRRELNVRLQNAPMEHAEALLAGYEVLQGLHESGVLDMLRGLLDSKDKIIEQAVDATNMPAGIRATRNLMVLANALGEMDPGALEAVTLSWAQALAETRQRAANPPGFWSLLRSFHGKDLRRGLVLVNTLLEKFGCNLCPDKIKTYE